MLRHRHWQRGGADLVSVGVGLTMLAIVFAGTTGSFIYGREALARQEHFKVVAYLLRAKMEEVQAAMQLVQKARDNNDPQNLLGECIYPPIMMESNQGREKQIAVYIHRRKVEEMRLPETGDIVAYYVLTMDASWHERDQAEDRRSSPGKLETLSFTTAFVPGRS
ncbi:MAG: hypothetical protein NT025_01660 [bacterium]|nr:hypothetical protein [bacterium]